MVGFLRTLMVAGLSALIVAVPSGGAVQPPRPFVSSAPEPAGVPLSVLTYNVKGLPWPIASGRDVALAQIADRLAALRQQGRQPHIVLLQEAFVPAAVAIAARAGYRYSVAGPDAGMRTFVAADAVDIAYLNRAFWHRGEQVAKPVSSGLLILSDYPITSSASIAFPDFACAGFDCLSNKGVLLAELAVPGVGMVSVVNTHLNSRGSAGVPIARSHRAFDRQVTLMADFVGSTVPAGRRLIVGGDVNIGRDRNRHQVFFERFAQAGLGFVAPPLGAIKRALGQRASATPGARRDLVHADEHGADWLFARGIGNAPLAVASAHVPFGTETVGDPLSDHYGYQIDYSVAPPAARARTT